MIVTWLGFGLAVVIAIGGACFLVGQIYSRTNRLEDSVDNQDKTLEKLNIRISDLEQTLKENETTIKKLFSMINELKKMSFQDSSTLGETFGRLTQKVETLHFNMDDIQGQARDLHKEVNELKNEMRSLSKKSK